MAEIRKPKLIKFKSTHFTEIGYNILRKEKSKLEKMRKDGLIEEGKSMMELNEIAIIKTYGEK